MIKTINLISAAFATILACTSLYGQNVSHSIRTDPRYSGGFYRSYPEPETDRTKIPKGYKPFYISHYGRHGSRWISSGAIYERTMRLLQEADKAGILTPSGKRLHALVRILYDDAEGRAGELTRKGEAEHKGIARRMYKNYPEIFKNRKGHPAEINCKATLYTRCILSMTAFCESLKEQDKDLNITKTASAKDTYYMSNYEYTDQTYKTALKVSDSLAKAWIRPDRFFNSIISDSRFISDIQSKPIAMLDFFHLASDIQAVGSYDFNLYGFFTEEELYTLWKTINAQTYIEEGPSPRFGYQCKSNAKSLLFNIINTADEVISGTRTERATLRFGHESNIVPLMSLMQIEGASKAVSFDETEEYWNISEICPMATNLQLIFFRNKSGNVKVRIMHNETDARIPFGKGPFYNWNELKDFLMAQIAM